jgi:multidrug resistance efflux pump
LPRRRARDETEQLLGVARNETATAEARIRDLTSSKEQESTAAAATVASLKEELEEAQMKLEVGGWVGGWVNCG